MNGKDFTAFFKAGKIKEKNLIKPSFTQQFRWEGSDIICCCNNKAGSSFILHPGEQVGKHSLAGSGISTAECKRFFDLVNPQDTGCNRLCK